MSSIIRPIAHGLGFDEFGQLNVEWMEGTSTVSTIIADMRDRTCPICGNGWEVSSESFRNQHFNRTTDEFVHKTCQKGHIEMRECEMWVRLLCQVRDSMKIKVGFHISKIPNEYRAAWNTSWYRVRMENYLPWLKLGTRSHVFHLGIYDLRPEQSEKFKELFKDEKSTTHSEGSEGYVHSWGDDDSTRILGHFFTILTMDEPLEPPDGSIKFRLNLGPKPVAALLESPEHH